MDWMKLLSAALFTVAAGLALSLRHRRLAVVMLTIGVLLIRAA